MAETDSPNLTLEQLLMSERIKIHPTVSNERFLEQFTTNAQGFATNMYVPQHVREKVVSYPVDLTNGTARKHDTPVIHLRLSQDFWLVFYQFNPTCNVPQTNPEEGLFYMMREKSTTSTMRRVAPEIPQTAQQPYRKQAVAAIYHHAMHEIWTNLQCGEYAQLGDPTITPVFREMLKLALPPEEEDVSHIPQQGVLPHFWNQEEDLERVPSSFTGRLKSSVIHHVNMMNTPCVLDIPKPVRVKDPEGREKNIPAGRWFITREQLMNHEFIWPQNNNRLMKVSKVLPGKHPVKHRDNFIGRL